MAQFEKADIKRWRRACHKELDALDATPAMRGPGLILCGVLGFGTDRTVLQEITGRPEVEVRLVLRKLRQQGILRGQTLRTGWLHNKHGWCAFLLDVMVAAGDISRTTPTPRVVRRRTAVRQPRRPRVTPPPGAVFTPKMVRADPYYVMPDHQAARR
jgi:hypothetical protein